MCISKQKTVYMYQSLQYPALYQANMPFQRLMLTEYNDAFWSDCVTMKFLSSQMTDRLRGLDSRTGFRRYAEVRCKVVWVEFWVCLPISLHLKFVSNRRGGGVHQFLLSDLDNWSIRLSKRQLPPTFLSDSVLILQCALTDLYLKYA